MKQVLKTLTLMPVVPLAKQFCANGMVELDMLKTIKLFFVFASALVCSNVCRGQDDYSDAVRMYSQRTPVLRSEKTLMNYLKKSKQGTGLVVFNRHVNTAETGIAICRFDVEDGKVRSAEMVTEAGTRPFSLNEFLSCCKEPSLLYYRDKIYWNIPDMTVRYFEGKRVCELLCPQMVEAKRRLSLGEPSVQFKCSISVPTFGKIQLGSFRMGDTIGHQEVVDAVCEHVEKGMVKEWKKKHDAMVRKLPRTPPVAYGDGEGITRNSKGTYIIPRKAPPTEQIITKNDIYFANGTSHTVNGNVVVNGGGGVNGSTVAPNGEFFITPNITTDCVGGDSPVVLTQVRKKKSSLAGQYFKLKQQLEEYEKQVDSVKNDKPPTADKDAVADKINTKCDLIFSILKQK